MSPTAQYSRIRFIDLQAEIARTKESPGFASISILKPVIYLELLKPERRHEPSENEHKDEYEIPSDTEKDPNQVTDDDVVRITTSFTLEVEILDFEHR
jgi:hypothetical protein